MALLLGSGGLLAAVRWWGERGKRRAEEKKIEAETDSIAVQTADKMLKRMALRLEDVNAALEQVTAEHNQDRQTMSLLESKCGKFESDIERLDGEAGKWRLLYLIAVQQMTAAGIKPIISIKDAENMTPQEVRRVFEASQRVAENLTPPGDEL
jgi:hypothetical protein